MRSQILLFMAATLTGVVASPRPADGEKSSSSAPTSVLLVTVGERALTTTFTPPATCTENRLTMLGDQKFVMWINEPMPVDGVTKTDCYPSEFMQGYTSIDGVSTSIAPLMSPLVCPQGWNTAQKWDNGYIACCPQHYQLHPPDKPDKGRPAFGGTCYSPFTLSQTTTVTLYDAKGVSATRQHILTATTDQAYGHVIDGYALDLLPSSTPASSSRSTQPAETSAPGDSTGSEDGGSEKSSDSLSGGAIAGIVIGSLAAVAFIILGALLFVRRRARKQGRESLGPTYDDASHLGSDGKPQPDVYAMQTHPGDGTGHSPAWLKTDGRSDMSGAASPSVTLTSPVSELGGRQRHELASTDYVELDSTHIKPEMQA